ncbi:uncharacterized protein LOC111334693 [Stylophora pistillata]|uniref:uncharacterized protein LOC111334693 n=1 Tax=Stylophora pistillata TaxID=50429 RepID=UPI000C0429A6|nr:uncharacterized protein LOC111334693 [Stylophora pistillata]
MEEVQKAIKQTSSGKAPGKDGIPAEIYKAAGPATLNAFHSLLYSIWEEEDIPQEFRDATIISLYKKKGSKSDCGNYRGYHSCLLLLRVYKTVVLTSLLYGCETWTLYRRHIKLLERFHMRSLRSILGIKWQDMITNLEVLDRAETTSIEAMILKAQLRWTGHIIRMDSDRIPKQLLYGVLSKGKRKQGRPLKRFKDCIKANIAYTGIATKQLEECAQDHTGWRALTREATKAFEAHRRANVTEARAKRKAAGETPKPPGQFPCSHCGRV